MYDCHVKGDSYHVNDMVFLHCPAIPRGLSRKFHKPWHGPYRVVKVIGPTVYRIADCTNPRKKKVVHFNRLKRAPIGKVPEPAKGEDMVEGARNNILPVGPIYGNRNGMDLVEDSLEEEMVWMPSTEVKDQAPKDPIAQLPGPPEEIPPAPAAQVPGPPEAIPPAPIAQLPGPPEEIPPAPVAQVPGPPEANPPAPVAQVPGQLAPSPAAVRRSTRQTRPPVRYGDPISLPDDVDIL